MSFTRIHCSLFVIFVAVSLCLAAKSDKDTGNADGKNSTKRRGPIDCLAFKNVSLASADESESSWIPECNATSNQLLPVQTMRKGQKFCVDLYTTGVLLGPTSSPTLECQCARAHKVSRLRKQSYRPVCDPVNGLYAAQQCDIAERKECWCVDAKSGVEVQGSKWAAQVGEQVDSGKCGKKA